MNGTGSADLRKRAKDGAYGMDPHYIPPLIELQNRLLFELARLMEQPCMIRHEEELARLEKLAIYYVLAALNKLGWEFKCGQTFSTVQMASTLGVVKRHRRLLERLLMMLSNDCILRRSDSLWEVISERAAPDMNEQLHTALESDPEAVLLDRCGSTLSEVLQGKLDPLQVLFPNGDSTTVARFYRDSPVMKAMNLLIQKMLLQVLLRQPLTGCCRILEIGAGTGSTTFYLLPHLSPDRAEYTFTDVSPVLILEGQEKFKDYSFVEYRALNVEGEPQRQGFHFYQYDFVVASNVFHATADLSRTVRNARQLMAPGGLLVLLELTASTRWIDLVFGLTQGWWRFTDIHLRPSYPLISAAEWMEVLNHGGFEEAFFISSDDLVTRGLTQVRRKVLPLSLIVAKAAAGKA